MIHRHKFIVSEQISRFRFVSRAGRNSEDIESEISDFCLGMQDAITETYSAYGCMLKPGQVAPVGEAFREFKRKHGDEYLTLYNTNGVSDHHASLKGAYVSACVHFSTLYSEPCTGNHFHGGLTSQDHIHQLQVAADTAVAQGSWNFPASSSCKLSIC